MCSALNATLFLHHFSRTDLTATLKDKLNVDTMLVSSSRSAHVAAVEEFQSNMNPKITTMVRIDDCGDIFSDTPDTFAYNMVSAST